MPKQPNIYAVNFTQPGPSPRHPSTVYDLGAYPSLEKLWDRMVQYMRETLSTGVRGTFTVSVLGAQRTLYYDWQRVQDHKAVGTRPETLAADMENFYRAVRKQKLDERQRSE